MKNYVAGSPDCLHVCKHMERNGGNPAGWLLRFSSAKKLEENNRNYHELYTICLALTQLGEIDQCN